MNRLSSIQTKRALLALLLLLSLHSLANDFYLTTSVINVRTGPGTEYQVAFILQRGEEVEVLAKGVSWYYIKYKGKTGYAHANNLQFGRSLKKPNYEKPQQILSFLLVGAYGLLVLFVGSILFIQIRNRRLLKTVTGLDRGTKTERDLVLKLLKYGLPAQDIFHDLYLLKGINEYAQIDLVALTKVGVIVFEVKSYNGWIFGRGNDDQWTQVYNFGKRKFRIYNPIKQNKGHITELKSQIGAEGNVPFFSCIVCFGSCVLKEINYVPNGTFITKSERVERVLKVIMQENIPIQYPNRDEIAKVLRRAVTAGANKDVQKQHIRNIKDMLGKHRIFE